MASTKPILLIHGAQHGAWCWRAVITELEKLGRRAVAIDLPGAGDDPADPAGVTMSDYTSRIIAKAEQIGSPVVLAGHSMGGLSITAAAELRPDLFGALVYVAALLPAHLQSGAMLMSMGDDKAEKEQQMKASSARDARLFEPFSEEISRAIFYHDCPDAMVNDALRRLRPISVSLPNSPMQLPTDGTKTLPRYYIECTEDLTLPIATQRAMIAAHSPIKVYSLASSHSPFFSMPEKLASILAEIA